MVGAAQAAARTALTPGDIKPAGREPRKAMPAGARSGAELPAVCGLGRFFELEVDLVKQFFGLLGVATHIPFVGSLCSRNLLPRLTRQPLGRGEIGMTSGIDISHRRIPHTRGTRQ